MFSRLIALSAAALVATAQNVELTARQNTLQASRRQELDLFSVSQMVDSLSTLMSSADGPAAAVARDMADRSMGLQSTATAAITRLDGADQRMASMESAMSQLQTSVTNQLSTAASANAARAAAAAAMLTASLTTAAENANATASTIRAETTALGNTLSRAAATQAATMSSAAATQASQMTAALTTMNSSVLGALALKATARAHVWIGGCSQHQHGGWNAACLDRNEIDTSAPYFRKASNYRIAAIKRGIYRMNMFTINNSCSWARIRCICHDEEKTYSLHHNMYSWWKDTSADTLCRLTQSQTMYFSTYASCGHNSKHHTSGNGRYHERQDYAWVGYERAQDI